MYDVGTHDLCSDLACIMHISCHFLTAEMLQNAWGTGLLADLSLFGSMVLVALPDGVLQSSPPYTYDAAERVQNALFHEFKIEVCLTVN